MKNEINDRNSAYALINSFNNYVDKLHKFMMNIIFSIKLPLEIKLFDFQIPTIMQTFKMYTQSKSVTQKCGRYIII